MTYKEALLYLDSFIDYEKIPYYEYKTSIKLNRMERLLDAVGNPQRGLKTIHITGTKGKGSTAAMVSSILTEAGFKTGLYTSPHLISFRERIRLNKKEISEDKICEILDEIRPAAEKIRKDEKISFFELYTTLAFLYFKKENVDFAVLEVGMGGRLDATNAADSTVSAITPISLEHTDKLGTTLGEIALEKAGVIKEKSVCITAPQKPEALRVIKDVCCRKNATLHCLEGDILFEEGSLDGTSQNFSVKGRFARYDDIKLKLLGRHQIVNASLALGIAESMRAYNSVVPEEAIRKGISNTYWPGRLEVINNDPLVVLDGAQNAESAKALVDAIKRHFSFDRVILILGISRDKDIKGISTALSNLAREVIVTEVKNPRAARAEEIAEFFHKDRVTIIPDSGEALDEAYRRAKEKDLILAAGSLYLAGEIKEAMSYNNPTGCCSS